MKRWTKYFRHRHSNKIFKNFKSIQRLLNPTNALWKDLMMYRLIKAQPFSNKNRSLGLTNTKICGNKTMKISLSNYLMLCYISQITTSLPPRLLKKFLSNPNFLNHTPNWTWALKISISIASHPIIFQKNLL